MTVSPTATPGASAPTAELEVLAPPATSAAASASAGLSSPASGTDHPAALPARTGEPPKPFVESRRRQGRVTMRCVCRVAKARCAAVTELDGHRKLTAEADQKRVPPELDALETLRCQDSHRLPCQGSPRPRPIKEGGPGPWANKHPRPGFCACLLTTTIPVSPPIRTAVPLGIGLPARPSASAAAAAT